MGDKSNLSEMIIPFLTMNVRQAAIARDHVEDYFAAFEFEAKTKLMQAGSSHRFPDPRFIVFAVEHQKSASTGAADFPSNRSILFREGVPSVDLVAADAA